MENSDKRFFVEQIKTKYIDENHMHIDRLKYLDKKASRCMGLLRTVYKNS